MDALLHELQQRGIHLQWQAGQLCVVAPPGALNEPLRAAIAQHRDALQRWLQVTEPRAPARAHDEPERYAPFALTEVQRAYWLGRNPAMALGGVSTHLYIEQACRGIDLERLNEALRTTIARHDMLRAVLDGSGQQRVLRNVARYEIAVADCRAYSADDAHAAALATREALSHQVLDPLQWPLFDIRATWMPGGELRLHLSLDLLILDATSLLLFLREWRRAYDGAVLPPPPNRRFRDHVLERAALRSGPQREAAQAYWTQRLPSLPPAPALPLRQDRSAHHRPRFRRRTLQIPAERWQRLKAHARHRGLTASCLLLAAYCEVLARWSSSARFTLNLTSSERATLHDVLGDFTSTVLLEVNRSDAAMGFVEFAAALQQRLRCDLAHGAFSGVEVLREWSRLHGVAAGAAMPIVFTSVLGGAEWRLDTFGPVVHGISQTPQVLIDHQVSEADGELTVVWDAVEDAFAPGVLDAMFASHAGLLDRLARDEHAWSATDLATLPEPMQQRRDASRHTALALPTQHLHDGMVARAREDADAPAVITPARQLTRGELLAEATAVADWLLDQGLQPGQPVAVLMHKGWEQMVAVLGAALAGGAYVPVDAGLPAKRQRELLTLCQAAHVLTQPAVAPPAGPWAVRALHPGTTACWRERHQRSLTGSPDCTAYVIFTSGTTGTPKGVMIDHRGATNTVLAINRLFGVTPHDAVLGVSSLSFDLSVYDIFGVLGAGGRLVLPQAPARHDPAHWAELMQAHEVTLWNSAPQLLAMLLDRLAPHAAMPGRLRTVLLSGDFIPLDTPARLRRHGCNAELVSLGGATEASIWSVVHRVQAIDPQWRSIPYGRALPNQTAWVLDAALRPTPDHVRGRIHIGGAGLAQGYLRDPARTASRFIHHPHTGERLYDTGDLGQYAEDGSIVILGRDDRQVKIRGHRVEPGEIEAVLCRHHAVLRAVVVATPASAGPRQLVAYVQWRPGTEPSPRALREHAAEHLPEYMVPPHVVPVEHLPLTANGKLDVQALQPLLQTGPGPVAPRTALERDILAVWRRVMPLAHIGVTDNFFDAGGDSVLATQLMHELEQALALDAPLHLLFECPTIEAMAQWFARQPAT